MNVNIGNTFGIGMFYNSFLAT